MLATLTASAHLRLGAPQHEHVLDRRRVGECLVGDVLRPATTEPRQPHAVSRDDPRLASLIRSFNNYAVNPPNTTECAAPMPHTSIAATVSGTIPM